ncbi:MAG: MscL family protein [Candidatus Nanoarchaeia archaeon]|nr:MscL family protein [Candidatus Nanoarchaeia archaeon]MDD5054514.1 MscL family protein [Candidatus Nanoarchaeia archaeon]MDD5499745.1 MscL family protein [Candidatus Nanoarchaeia archaeon]
MKLIDEFRDFLKEYKILGLAIAFIMGGVIKDLVNSISNDIIMPLLTPFIPGGAWQESTLMLGPIIIKIGSFAGNLLNFIVIALVIFLMAKFLLKEEKVSKK